MGNKSTINLFPSVIIFYYCKRYPFYSLYFDKIYVTLTIYFSILLLYYGVRDLKNISTRHVIPSDLFRFRFAIITMANGKISTGAVTPNIRGTGKLETFISTTQDTTVLLKSIQYYILKKIYRGYISQVMVPLMPKLLGQPKTIT